MTIPFNVEDIKSILKGGGAVVLGFWVIAQQYTINAQGKSIDKLHNQMYELQNSVIKDYNRTVAEFNLINKSK